MNLADHQIEKVNEALPILKAFNFVYLKMETRTGKTLTSLSIAEQAGFNNVLFITKKKAIKSVMSDYEKFGFKFNFHCINYDILHKVEFIPDLLIIDEAHSLGAFPKPSIRFKMLQKYNYASMIFLSATPSPESYSQLFHQFNLPQNSPFAQYRNFYKWFAEYGIPAQKRAAGGRFVNDYSKTKKDQIDKILNKFYVSCTQKEAGFSVEIEEEYIIVPTPLKIIKLFNIVKNDNYYKSERLEIIADSAVKVLSKCHQIASGTIINENGDQDILDKYKALHIYNFLEKNQGLKICIFYKFQAENTMLKQVFSDLITESPEEFQASDKIFIGQFQSIREGVNLSSADFIFMLNIDFSAVSYLQSINRLQNMHREHPAKIIWLFSETGLEEKIYKTVKYKQKNFTARHFISKKK